MEDTREAFTGAIGEGIDEYLFYLLNQVVNRRNRDFAPALAELGLSSPHWRAMSTINRLDGCLMSEMAEFTTVDRTTLTRTVDLLVEAGLVVRTALPEDRRLVRVALTDAGHAVFEQALDALKRHNETILRGFSQGELKALRAVLQRLMSNIVDDPALFEQLLKYNR